MRYLLCRSLSVFLCLFYAGLPVFAVSPAQAADQPPDVREVELLELYFDEDQLVEAATRYPKPISQVAENVTIVTAEEIEAMNAHTVAEVLRRVPGVFIDFNGRDFVAGSSIHIHDSDYEHVLVLVDGVRWSSVGSDFSETVTVPVQIIKRIEVIKGAASSTWGSALGGVINIITKDAGKTAGPTGTISASQGEFNSREYRADMAGHFGPAGYYLYAGVQKSDGIQLNRFVDNQSFYGKLEFALPRNSDLTFSFGRSAPERKTYHWETWDDEGLDDSSKSLYTANLDTPLTDQINLNLLLYQFEDHFSDSWRTISTQVIYNKNIIEGIKRGMAGRLNWNHADHSIVLGVETERRESTVRNGMTNVSNPTVYDETLAFYANDTYRINSLVLTPGLRYDRLSLVDDVISPSLGLVYHVNSSTLLRAGVSRGFRSPAPQLKRDNPQLKNETIRSYQAGIETAALKFFRLKTTFFFHDSDDDWDSSPAGWGNGGVFQRKGIEVEMETRPFHNFSLALNGTYVRQLPEAGGNSTQYNCNIRLGYDDQNSLKAQLFGHYVWWGRTGPTAFWNEYYGRFIWDFDLARKIYKRDSLQVEAFFSGHNIFNGQEYTQMIYTNAPRWLEGGIRIRY